MDMYTIYYNILVIQDFRYPNCLKKGGYPGKNEGRLQIPDQKRGEVARQKRGEGGLLVFKRYRAFLAKIWVNIIPK